MIKATCCKREVVLWAFPLTKPFLQKTGIIWTAKEKFLSPHWNPIDLSQNFTIWKKAMSA